MQDQKPGNKQHFVQMVLIEEEELRPANLDRVLSSRGPSQPQVFQSFQSETMPPKRPASSAHSATHSSRVVRPRKEVNYNEEQVIEQTKNPARGKGGIRGGDASTEVKITREIQPGHIVKKDAQGHYLFDDFPTFRPNLSPKEVLQLGSFGGGYFRPIYSSVVGKNLSKVWEQDLPKDWIEGLSI